MDFKEIYILTTINSKDGLVEGMCQFGLKEDAEEAFNHKIEQIRAQTKHIEVDPDLDEQKIVKEIDQVDKHKHFRSKSIILTKECDNECGYGPTITTVELNYIICLSKHTIIL